MLTDIDQCHLKVLSVLLLDVCEDQTGEERYNCRNERKTANYKSRESFNKTGSYVVSKNRNEESYTYESKKQGYQ